MWAITALVGFGLGVWLGPKFKLWTIHMRSDPLGTINAEIAALRAVKDRVLGVKPVTKPPSGAA